MTFEADTPGHIGDELDPAVLEWLVGVVLVGLAVGVARWVTVGVGVGVGVAVVEAVTVTTVVPAGAAVELTGPTLIGATLLAGPVFGAALLIGTLAGGIGRAPAELDATTGAVPVTAVPPAVVEQAVTSVASRADATHRDILVMDVRYVSIARPGW
ncbi:hypothetical protein [Nakamurella panacisegetis]|uniref:hypothetical protein n=1 Tax=Nakamurella panacisegetis TaxID=1090615 RepID=UPI0012FD6835|nr:hypothetical protein [Nakamurella panacisegetis]